MRHKHATRSGASTTGTGVRDRYGFEVVKGQRCIDCQSHVLAVVYPAVRLCGSLFVLQVKKDMLSQYQNYAPLWEKEELERSERWDAFLAHFETAYYKDSKQYVVQY